MISLIDLAIKKFLSELDTNAPVGFSPCGAKNPFKFFRKYVPVFCLVYQSICFSALSIEL